MQDLEYIHSNKFKQETISDLTFKVIDCTKSSNKYCTPYIDGGDEKQNDRQTRLYREGGSPGQRNTPKEAMIDSPAQPRVLVVLTETP